jgi:hypothetical protein
MTKTDFTTALQTDAWFDSPDELIDYRLPVVQYYMQTYTNRLIVVNGAMLSTRHVNIVYREQDFCLVNQAYEYIKNEFNEGKLK